MNDGYHSVQNLLWFHLLPKIMKICIARITALRFVVYGCETWSLTMRKEHRLRVFEGRVLGRMFGAKRDETTGGGVCFAIDTFLTE